MNSSSTSRARRNRVCQLLLAGGITIATSCAASQLSDETNRRVAIAATNLEDAVVVDCQLPGKLRKLGGTRNYLTPGRLIRTSAIVCRTRGGEYTLGDLSSGTLSLQRWLPLAQNGDAEAQYYVARIYANGMDNVPVDFVEAARWYQMAADQDFSEAQQELGYLYEQGLGVPKDELKALNLQREASGLGSDLDYAYKIADARAEVQRLAAELAASNGALRDAQLALSDRQEALDEARAGNRSQAVQLTRLVAELESARRHAGGAPSGQVAAAERELEAARAELERRQRVIVELERDRDTAKTALDLQIMGGQSAQRELRELLARAERAEDNAASLGSELAEAQQRLINAEEEVRSLRTSYRDQSAQLANARAQLLEARAAADSDAAAYLAVQEAEVAAQSARIAALQSEVESLERQVAEAARGDGEQALRRQLAALQSKYDDERAALQAATERLQADFRKSTQELSALYAATRRDLDARGEALSASRREADRLAGEADELRALVEQLEKDRLLAATQSGSEVERLTAQLSQARQEAVAQRNSLDELRAQKAALEAALAASRMALETQLAAGEQANALELELLRAEIAGAESTIRAQTLRIEKLEREVRARDQQLAQLKAEFGERQADAMPAHVRSALAVLEKARSEPTLGRFYALFIANEDYQYMAPLTTPVRDAMEISELLRTRYGFDVEVVRNATRKDIAVKLDEYVRKLTPEDNLLVYYAGRGEIPPGQPPDRAFWFGVDADPEQYVTWLAADVVSDIIAQMDAKRVLLVTDSCFARRRMLASGASVGRQLNEQRFARQLPLPSRQVLTSGANVPVYDEKGDRTHSLFAQNFMEILRQNSIVLSGEMLSFEMARRIAETVDDAERAIPTFHALEGTGHRFGEFYFVPTQQATLVADAGPVAARF